MGPSVPPSPEVAPPDPMALLRTPAYVRLLVLSALLGFPVRALPSGHLELLAELHSLLFDNLPGCLRFASPPTWWPMPLLAVSGLLTALAILKLPGTRGHSPVDGFKMGGALPPSQLPGV